ncbi:carbohydrate-binding family 9-like protein [Adhaeribacter pallidiroseus]|uniref:Carbohydrate-binding domain-containing protein n=1 Tax=Adhaeribacter pallidiroseus TaxID=2072847 RepID=A0A369QG95_9BACT|nr:carbohydrate-binding family 9-like protein [Adhaeribacter pallidiroseus]RDC62565.1 hypothetical protein AHMF7616_01159 [Adhaeribacter pallidiroseus]
MTNNFLKILITCLFLGLAESGWAQANISGKEALFTEPQRYTTYFAPNPPVVDGNITEAAWQAAPWTDYFTDIEGDQNPRPTYKTRVKILWNDTCLFLAAELEEPQVWATLKKHDAIIYQDNDFEIFIDPDNDTHHYFEIEVNALNTLFDLYLDKPYRNGGLALIPWRAEGLQSAVQVQGTLNQPQDIDKSWTVEMVIPFRTMKTGKITTPSDKDFWRINFSRVHWDTSIKNGLYEKITDSQGKPKPEHNWVWSPQGLINMHFPERWGYLFFSRQPAPKEPAAVFTLPTAEKQKKYLWNIYYLQKEYYQKHRQYARTLLDLAAPANKLLPPETSPEIKLEATTHQFMAYCTGPDNLTYTINQDGHLQKLNFKK